MEKHKKNISILPTDLLLKRSGITAHMRDVQCTHNP